MQENIIITAVGDILFCRSINDYVNKYNDGDYSNIFTHINKYTKDSDISLCNLECVISTNIKSRLFLKGGPSFCAELKSIEALKNSNFNNINISNNHSNDYDNIGIKDTINILKKNDFNILGLNNIPYKKYNIDNCKIIIVGMSTFFKRLKNNKHIYIYNKDTPKLLKNLKTKCDLLIVTIHWGTEYIFQNNEKQKKIAIEMIKNGVDIIIGHHPHVIQNMEKININNNYGYVFYSLGNFVLDDPHNKLGVRDNYILKILINKTTKKYNFEYLPCIIYPQLGFIPKPIYKKFVDKFPSFYTKKATKLDKYVNRYFNDNNKPYGYNCRFFKKTGGFNSKEYNCHLLFIFTLFFICFFTIKN